MQYLFGNKKLGLALFFSLWCVGIAFAQVKGSYNYLNFANKRYYFGITLGYNSSQYAVARSKNFILNDSIRSLYSPSNAGFNLGMIANYKLNNYFDIRVVPTLSFASRSVMFERVTGNETRKNVESVFVELPVQVRFKSALYHDFRLFVLSGVKYSYDVSSRSRTRNGATQLKVSPSDYQIEVGAGAQFYFPFFIFSPEVKYSQGVSNLLIYNNQLIYSNVIDRLFSRTLTVSLHFEG